MKLNKIPRLGLGDSKMSLDIGGYLHIHVLEYIFYISILRYFYSFLENFLGHTSFLRGVWGPILQLDPPIFFWLICCYIPSGCQIFNNPKK